MNSNDKLNKTNPGTKQSKTLYDFFKANSSQENSNTTNEVDTQKNSSSVPSSGSKPAVVKVNCPGCDELVSQARINWHLDQDCSSRKSKTKKKKRYFSKAKTKSSAPKKKAAPKTPSTTKKTDTVYSPKARKVLLSDDSDDDFVNDGDAELILFDLPEDDGTESPQEEIFINASMVETQLVETEDYVPTTNDKNKNSTKLQVKNMLEEDWFLDIETEDVSPATQPPVKRRTFDLSLPVVPKNTKEIDKTTDEIESPVNASQLLNKDKVKTPDNTSKKSDVNSKIDEVINSRTTAQMTTVLHADNDDFIPQSQSFRTPIKQQLTRSGSSSKKKSLRTRTNRSPVNLINNELKCLNNVNPKPLATEADVAQSTSTIQTDTKSQIADSQFVNNGLPDTDVDTDSNSCSYSPLRSPLVFSTRTPSPSPVKTLRIANVMPSPSKRDINSFGELLGSQHKKKTTPNDGKMWHTPTPNKMSPVVSPEKRSIQKSINYSPSIRRNMARFGLSSPSAKSSQSPSKSDKQDHTINGISKSSSCRSLFNITSVVGNYKENSPEGLEHAGNSTSINNIHSKDKDGMEADVNNSSKIPNACSTSPSKQLLPVTPSKTKSSDINSLRKTPSKTPSKLHSKSPVTFSSKSPAKSPGKKNPEHYRNHTGYYLENFQTIIDAVCSTPGDYKLFNEEDKAIINTFIDLSLPAKKLYVRLFQRNLKWKRVDKIEYLDICDKEDTLLYVKELSYAKYLLTEDELTDVEEVLSLMTGEEVASLCKTMKVNTAGRSKTDLMDALVRNSKKQPTIAAAFACRRASSSQLLLNRAKEQVGNCCVLVRSVRRLFMLVLVLYSLPRFEEDDESGQHMQLVNMLRVNMGQVKYPTNVVTNRNCDIFAAREDLFRFGQCQELYSGVRDHLDSQRWQEALAVCLRADELYTELLADQRLVQHDQTLPTFLRRYTCLSLLVYLKTCQVEALQRMRKYSEAIIVLRCLLAQRSYMQDYRGAWYDRLAINFDHLKMHLKALEVIKDAMQDPEVRVGHRLSLSIRGQRSIASQRKAAAARLKKMKKNADENDVANCAVAKKLEALASQFQFMDPQEAPGVVIEGRSFEVERKTGFRRVFIRGDSAVNTNEGNVMACSVEELALGHYTQQGYTEGLHAEGSTINALFGVLLWRVVYCSYVPDAFRLPHQHAPLDLDYLHFYTSRQEDVDSRVATVAEMTADEVSKAVIEVWEQHHGEACIVKWDLFKSPQHLTGLILSLGVGVVAKICTRLAKDHRFTRSGFPDLIVWNPEKKISRIVEVKGPNDRLSTKQTLWLDYLLQCGATAEVCHVEAIGAKNMSAAAARVLSPSAKRNKTPSPGKSTPQSSPAAARHKRGWDNSDDSDDDFAALERATDNTKKRKA